MPWFVHHYSQLKCFKTLLQFNCKLFESLVKHSNSDILHWRWRHENSTLNSDMILLIITFLQWFHPFDKLIRFFLQAIFFEVNSWLKFWDKNHTRTTKLSLIYFVFHASLVKKISFENSTQSYIEKWFTVWLEYSAKKKSYNILRMLVWRTAALLAKITKVIFTNKIQFTGPKTYAFKEMQTYIIFWSWRVFLEQVGNTCKRSTSTKTHVQ